MNENKYGKLINRIKALLIDLVVLMGMGIAASTILSKYENVQDSVRIAIFIFIFFLYDPLLTSFAGGTIGHLFMGLRVRKNKDESKNIIFPLAFVRFIFKASLGWISLLTVPGHEKNKAIHDIIVGSVLIQENK